MPNYFFLICTLNLSLLLFPTTHIPLDNTGTRLPIIATKFYISSKYLFELSLIFMTDQEKTYFLSTLVKSNYCINILVSLTNLRLGISNCQRTVEFSNFRSVGRPVDKFYDLGGRDNFLNTLNLGVLVENIQQVLGNKELACNFLIQIGCNNLRRCFSRRYYLQK